VFRMWVGPTLAYFRTVSQYLRSGTETRARRPCSRNCSQPADLESKERLTDSEAEVLTTQQEEEGEDG
jgi:hypothetical protein